MADYFVTRPDGFAHIDADPDAELTFTWNWAKWRSRNATGALDPADAHVDVDLGIELVSSVAVAGDLVAATISMAGAEVGHSYKAACRIATLDTPPQKDVRTIVIDVRQR